MDRHRTIAILDDDPAHLNEMVRRLSKRFGRNSFATFREAAAILEWLDRGTDECALLSLDDDLGSASVVGAGTEVVEWLAGQKPFCPVIVHGVLPFEAPRMENALAAAGWNCIRVSPESGTDWIGATWYPAARDLLSRCV